MDSRARETLPNGNGSLAMRHIIKHRVEVTADNKVVFAKEDEGALWDALWNASTAVRTLFETSRTDNVGQKNSKSLNITVSCECTMNQIEKRRPNRPKDVIAAEKARKAAEAQARNEQRAELEKEAQQRVVNLRKRIKHQVDHAFATGKSGTEPASKYITCQHCDAPAVLLHLNQKLSPGAAVLDEDTIIGAVCDTHSNWGGNVEKIPCAKLEFFYDGIRQIAIKR